MKIQKLIKILKQFQKEGIKEVYFANDSEFNQTFKDGTIWEFDEKENDCVVVSPNESTKFDLRHVLKKQSFVEGEIIGMESFHKLNIPLIHLTTSSEKRNREEFESDRIIKSNSNTEFDSKPITDPSSMTPLDPKTISDKHDTNPSTSNINSGNAITM